MTRYDTSGRNVEDVEAATAALISRVNQISVGPKTEYAGLAWPGLGPLLYAIVDALEDLQAGRNDRDEWERMAKNWQKAYDDEREKNEAPQRSQP